MTCAPSGSLGGLKSDLLLHWAALDSPSPCVGGRILCMESSGIFKRERNYRENSVTLNLITMVRIFPGSEDMDPLEHFVSTVFIFNMFF